MARPRKLTDEQREALIRVWRNRPTLKKLAKAYGLNEKTVSRYLKEPASVLHEDATPQAA